MQINVINTAAIEIAIPLHIPQNVLYCDHNYGSQLSMVTLTHITLDNVSQL